MSGEINLRQLMADAQTPNRVLLEQTRNLANKWEPTGLLEGLDGDNERHGMAFLLENQARQLIDESTTTNPTSAGIAVGAAGSGEQWAGVALPLVRKVFGEIAAKEFVSIQPMNLPSGLIFFMDFKYGTDKLPRTTGDSVFGATKTGDGGVLFPAASVVPGGGLDGDGAFGYSINDITATQTDFASSASVSSASVNFNETNVANLDNLRFFEVAVTDLTRPDLEGVRAFVPLSGSVELPGWLPEYTFLSGSSTAGTVVFVGYATASNSEPLVSSVLYHAHPTDSTRGDFEDTRSEIVASSAI